jgi:hypothetical protein
VRRWARWLIGLAAGLVLVGAVGRLLLPAAVRWVVAGQIGAALGRPASIEGVQLDLRKGWVRLRGLAVADGEAGPPLLELRRLELRLHWLSLLRGVIRVQELALVGPTLRLVRVGPRELNISEALARRRTAEPGGRGLPYVVERLRLAEGRVTFEDRVLSPVRTTQASEIRLDLDGLSTQPGDPAGRGSASLTLAGAPLALSVEELALAPFRARVRAELDALDLAPLWAYVPDGAALRPAGGRATLRLALVHDGAAVRLDGELGVADVAVLRPGPSPLVEVPRLAVTAREVTHRGGVVTLGRIELVSEPTVVDASASPPRRYAVRPLRASVEGGSLTPGRPGRVRVEAGLPDGARLAVDGTADLGAGTGQLAVTLTGLPAARLAPYIPPVSPVSVARGRLEAALEVGYTAAPRVEVRGDLDARGLVLVRRDRAEPFVHHPRLRLAIQDAVWADGGLAVRRLALTGMPTVTDSTASPPLHAEFTRLALVADGVTWPSRGPARVRLEGVVREGGRATIAGLFDPGTLATDVRATFAGLDLSRASGYLPPASPIALGQGRLDGRVGVRFDRAGGLRVEAEGAVADVVLRRAGSDAPLIEDRRVGFRVADLAWKDRRLAIGHVAVTGAPSLTDHATTPPRRLALRGLAARAGALAWPPRDPVPVEIDAALPGAGTLEVRGRVGLATRSGDLSIVLRDAAVEGLQDWLVVAGPLRGTVDAELRGTLEWGAGLGLGLRGGARARGLALGPAERPPLAIRALDLTGVAVRWPEEVRVARLGVTGLSGLVEREPDGRLPLRALLAPRATAAVPAPEAPPPARSPAGPAALPAAGGAAASPAGLPRARAPAPPAAGPDPGSPAAAGPRLLVLIEEAVLEDADLRFVDRGTSPFYSEEISRVVVRVRGLTTAPDGEAALTVQAAVGGTGSLDLAGRVAPFGRPFFLEVQGELREFALPRTNPVFRRLFAWLVKRGSLTTRLHYRIVGDQFEALNDVQVEGIGVERDTPAEGEGRPRIALPLGLLVAVATDSRGDIAFPLPVRGRLGAPEFSLGGAIWAGVRNALLNLVAGPVNAIGRLFRSGDEEPGVRVDPLEFAPGAAVLTAEGDRQLQRLADFLRAAPNASLEIRPVVTERDLLSLRTQEVVARIQRRQREQAIEGFAAAAARLHLEAFPERPVPPSADEIVEALRDREPVPAEAAAQLGARRVEAAREALVSRSGIAAGRLRAAAPAPGPAPGGAGRVEFELAE